MLKNGSNHEIRDMIIEKYESFSKNEKKVGKYITDHFTEAALLSSSELAQKSGVSDSSVIRFVRTLGFKGYIDFKKAMRTAIKTENSPYDSLKSMNRTAKGKYVSEYLSSEVSHIDAFLKQLDFHLIDKIADCVLAAKTIYLVGIDSDAVVAEYLYEYFSKMGFNAIMLDHTGFTLRKKLVDISECDIIMMSTFPRHLKDEEKTAALAKSRGAKLITFSDSDVIGNLFGSDINISVPDIKLAFFNSNVLSMVLCNIILLRIYEKSPESIEDHLQKYGDVVSDSDWLT